jgi:tetratricopeptide (TPR) repeat protein
MASRPVPSTVRSVASLRVLLGVSATCLLAVGCGQDPELVRLSNEGVRALQENDYTFAKTAFDKARALDPTDADVNFYLGSLALRDEEYQTAVAFLRTSVQVDSARPDAHLSLARALIGAAEPKAALDALKPLFRLDPGHPNGHLLAARIALDSADRITGERELRSAIEGDPGFAPAYVRLAQLYSDVEAYEAARDVLVEGLQFAPQSVELQESLGLAWMDLGRPDRAKVVLAKATQHPKARHHLFLNYAAALLQLGEKEPAIEALRTFIVQAHGRGADPAVEVAVNMLARLRKTPR